MLGSVASGACADGAKALFYTPEGSSVMPKTSAPAEAGRAPRNGATAQTGERFLGIKYSIELVKPDGSRYDVVPEYIFQSGDRIKIRVETNRDGYLYLVNVGSTGRYHLLFPHPRLAGGSNAVKARTVYDIPYGAYIRFDANPGDETLLIVLSPGPMSGLPTPDVRTRTLTEAEGQRLVKTAQLRGAKDLTLEIDSGPEPAGYAVAPLSTLGEQVSIVLEIKLRHR